MMCIHIYICMYIMYVYTSHTTCAYKGPCNVYNKCNMYNSNFIMLEYQSHERYRRAFRPVLMNHRGNNLIQFPRSHSHLIPKHTRTYTMYA